MKDETEASAKAVVMGKLGKTHGVKGWLRVISFTSPEDNILDYSVFNAKSGRQSQSIEIDDYKQQSAGIIAHIKGYDTPEEAKTLTGSTLSVDVSELPALEDGEVYWHQLEGLKVVNQQDQILGRIDKLLETGANDVLVVQASIDSIDDRERLIPYRLGATVAEIDLKAAVVRVEWDADYLE